MNFALLIIKKQKNFFMNTIKIQIPNMISSHCQMRVTNAIANINGISISHVIPGEVAINLSDAASEHKVVSAIQNAGYTVANVLNEAFTHE
jgi:copper chaperone